MRFFSGFFNKKHTVEPFSCKNGRCVTDFDLLSVMQRERFIRRLPAMEIRLLTLRHCNEMDIRCCVIPKHYLPEIVAALIQNQQIESLTLGKEFLQSHRFWNPKRSGPNSEREYYPYLANLEKLLCMASLRTLKLAVSADANFEKLEIYLYDSDCQLECLEITSELTLQQMLILRRIIQGSTSLQRYKGFEEDVFQGILEKKRQDRVQHYEAMQRVTRIGAA